MGNFFYNAYHKHLSRMKKDMQYMKEKIHELKNDISQKMKIKFGKVVDINEIEEAIIKKSFKKTQVNELEEVMLKKMVFDIRMKTTDIKQIYAKEYSTWIKNIAATQSQVSEIIKENTMKLELLRMLNQEKRELIAIIDNQPKKLEFLDRNQQTYQQFLLDISNLEDIVKNQCKELQELRSEIKMLKTKGLPPRTPAVVEEEYKKLELEPLENFQTAMQEEEEEEEGFVTNITMPIFYPTESEDLVRDLLDKLVKELPSNIHLDEPHKISSTEEMIGDILNSVLQCTSVRDIIHEIINRIPIEPNEEQQSAIKSTAEKLHQIQEVDADSATMCAREHLESIIDEVMVIETEPIAIMTKMVGNLVQSVPFEFIMEEKSIQTICQKVEENIQKEQLKPDDLKTFIESIPSHLKEEVETILNTILERVFGIGIDYLYVMK